MDNKTRCVDYGRDIADLQCVVKALQLQVALLQKRLGDSGTLYGGAVTYNTTAIGKVFNKATGEYI